MAEKRQANWRLLGCAAIAGATIALPIGILAGRLSSTAEETPASTASTSASRARNVYSPDFRKDPYVIEQQRRVVEALEQSCRDSKLHCKEAEQARLRIEEAAARE